MNIKIEAELCEAWQSAAVAGAQRSKSPGILLQRARSPGEPKDVKKPEWREGCMAVLESLTSHLGTSQVRWFLFGWIGLVFHLFVFNSDITRR